MLLLIDLPSIRLNNLTFIDRRYSLFKIFIMIPFAALWPLPRWSGYTTQP
jgi:hypothetical protein